MTILLGSPPLPGNVSGQCAQGSRPLLNLIFFPPILFCQNTKIKDSPKLVYVNNPINIALTLYACLFSDTCVLLKTLFSFPYVHLFWCYFETLRFEQTPKICMCLFRDTCVLLKI